MMNVFKRSVFITTALIVVMGFIPFAHPLRASAAVNPNYLILDKTFENMGSETVAQINSLLNGYSSSCISSNNGFITPDPQGWNGSSYAFGGNVSAGQAIYDTAQLYNVSPQVLLTTLQKEQSVVTGSAGCYSNSPDPNWPAASPDQPTPGRTFTCTINGSSTTCTYACSYSGGCINIAMSYNCPGYCKAANESFQLQLTLGAWILRFAEERSYGILSGYHGYETGDENFTYSGPMTPGNRARVNGGTTTYYDGSWTTSDGTSVSITNGGTASLYSYTPYLSGNTSFVNIFSGWFGSPVSPCYSSTSISGTTSGEHLVPTKLGINHTDNLSIVQLNNTGTTCMEAYTWQNNNYDAWLRLIASVSPAIDPSESNIISADTNGDGVDELYKVDYAGTSSGRIEVHGLTSNLQGYSSHVATISPSISHSDAEVMACDPAGYGRDNLFLVQYRNTTSGDIEIHEFSQNLQQWVNHWDTHYGAVSPQNAQIVCGDANGDGKDEFYLVQYNSTGSGRLEIHGGITNLPYVSPWPYASPVQWPAHTATISGYRTHWEGSTAFSADDADLIFADTVGNGVDRPYIVQYHATGSGRVEIYQMSNDFKNWVMLTTTNQGAY